MEIYYHIRDEYGFGAIIKEFDKEEFKKWIIKCENHSYWDSDSADESYIEGVIVFSVSYGEEYEIPFYYSESYFNEDEGVYDLVTETDLFELFNTN